MANLYEINEEIKNTIDLETGEIVDFEAFEKLQMERTEKLENIALWYKNLFLRSILHRNTVVLLLVHLHLHLT